MSDLAGGRDPDRPHSVGGAAGLSRRVFLANVFLGLAGLLGAAALAQRFFAFLSPPAPPERVVEVPAIALESVPDGGGTVVHLAGGHFAIERRGQTVRAFSAVCTHLGCVIQWQPTSDQAWYCPCHHGRYDRDGRVVGGPPPRPLIPVEASVRDGQVIVKLKVRPAAEVA
ncbi:MAG: Rieske (2Fe-2S) protein [Candidatus Eisenbacteria bacterium]|nr:Rieske (2Fe-2S) protein [Candidatus Eisenbacteria bacterium]